jgi:cytolysin-activating lysine-acyltransferase
MSSAIRVVRFTRRWPFERHFGTIVQLMIRNGGFAEDMAAVINNARGAVAHGQVYYFHDLYKRVCGCALWALLSPEVEQRVLKSQSLILHESEWNEGDRFWVVFFATNFGFTSQIIAALKKQVLTRHDEISFLRPKTGRLMAPIRVIRSLGTTGSK